MASVLLQVRHTSSYRSYRCYRSYGPIALVMSCKPVYCILEFICDEIILRFFLLMFKIAKIRSQKISMLYSDYSCDEFSQKISIAKIFPSKFPVIFANIFQHKIIPVYSTQHHSRGMGQAPWWLFALTLM